ncbi:MAG TPA: GNAT family N-acetyltransferase, partial [Chloroflexota bacterium]|nr:GNAT family N-acetyltransferase [Chloroflexota bacterium]
MLDLTIRRARAEDKQAVMDISSTVWQGDDYIPRVWDWWIEEDEQCGFLITGESESRVVAVQHTSLQPESVAWMEGIRVHPDYRNRGIGNRMLEYALRQARERGCTRARLSTAQVNVASSTIATAHEFREIAQFGI